MCKRKRSRPSSRRRLTKNVKRLSCASCGCSSAIGVEDEHKFRTNGPLGAAAPAADTVRSSVPACGTAPDANFGVGVINSPAIRQIGSSPATHVGFKIRGGGECMRSRCVRDRGSPAVIGILSFRPVALRPRLSTGLPLSTGVKCRSVADFSQVFKPCRDSRNTASARSRRAEYVSCLKVATVKLKDVTRNGPHGPNASDSKGHPARHRKPLRPDEERARSARRRRRCQRDRRDGPQFERTADPLAVDLRAPQAAPQGSVWPPCAESPSQRPHERTPPVRCNQNPPDRHRRNDRECRSAELRTARCRRPCRSQLPDAVGKKRRLRPAAALQSQRDPIYWLQLGGQPASRTSLDSRVAIVRACSSSVTAWVDMGRAR